MGTFDEVLEVLVEQAHQVRVLRVSWLIAP